MSGLALLRLRLPWYVLRTDYGDWCARLDSARRGGISFPQNVENYGKAFVDIPFEKRQMFSQINPFFSSKF
jgi:hypothetical protein